MNIKFRLTTTTFNDTVSMTKGARRFEEVRKFTRRVLSAAHYPLQWSNNLGRRVHLRSAGVLRVLLFHDIAPGERERFAAQIRWLARDWRFVNAAEFAAMITGAEPILGHNLLLTFDDGFQSNRWAAEAVLNPLGIRAVFFIPSDFMNLSDRPAQTQFIADNIFDGAMSPDDVPEYWTPMNWGDLAALLEMGHTVGSHSRSHARLSRVPDIQHLKAELVGSAAQLEGRLGTKVEHFAYPFGDVESISLAALCLGRQRYRFIHSGIRGCNSAATPAWGVRRDSLQPTDSLNYLGAILEGGLDWYYRTRGRQLDVLGRERATL